MKKFALLLLIVTGGAFAQTDVAKFKAKIANRNSDSLVIQGRNLKQVLRINPKGEFEGSFAVTDGPHMLSDGTEQTLMYLKNGFDLSLVMDAKEFDESIVYSGKGANENNFLAFKALEDEKIEMQMETLDAAGLDAMLAARAKSLEGKLVDVDANFKTLLTNVYQAEAKQMAAMHQQQLAVSNLAGTISPSFEYENYKGGKTKLEDLRGKYVYIDNWATWCGPCIREIPAMKEIEKKYHGKNITFVSISIDEKKDYEKWRKMVASKELGGVQLIADAAWQSKFMQDYGVQSIPRFILIGPDGKVVDANAKRPSDPALAAQLDGLLK